MRRVITTAAGITLTSAVAASLALWPVHTQRAPSAGDRALDLLEKTIPEGQDAMAPLARGELYMSVRSNRGVSRAQMQFHVE